MRPSRPDLIVPVRDRRQRKRILTLKNLAFAVAIAVAAFAGITIEANFRHSKRDSSFGIFYRHQVSARSEAKTKDLEIITEGPASDSAAADPMLITPSAREQLRRADSNVPDARTTTLAPEQAPVPGTTGSAEAGSHVPIVGSPGSAAVAQRTGRTQVLGGGFGRE